MKNAALLIMGVICCFALSACTGTSVTVSPEAGPLAGKYKPKCGAVAVKEIPSTVVYPPAGNMTQSFAAALEQSGLAEKVFYPSRPDDKFDLMLESKFDMRFDANTGSNMTKSFFTGFTLFLLEPVMWFTYNYELDGEVNVVKQSRRSGPLKARSTGEMSMKFLSLGEVQKLEGEVLAKSKEAAYQQLFAELEKICGK